jgi:large subunit ribosomal protein L23Ae
MSDTEKKEEQKPKKPRAQKFANLIKKGRNGLVKYQAYRKSPSFKRSKRSLLQLKRKPKVIRKSIEREKTWDRYSILLAPCSSERFYKKMENENTIIFYVNQKANKQEIKKAFKDAFNVLPQRVNTMNTILGRKKAFIKLPKTTEASEIASKIGLI